MIPDQCAIWKRSFSIGRLHFNLQSQSKKRIVLPHLKNERGAERVCVTETSTTQKCTSQKQEEEVTFLNRNFLIKELYCDFLEMYTFTFKMNNKEDWGWVTEMILVCYWFVLFWKTMSHTLVKEDLNFGSS